MDVLDYLRSKGVPLKAAGVHNVHTHCWWCREDPSKRGRLYINIDPNMRPPGLFHCHLCGEQGAFNKIRKFFGDPPLDDDGNEFGKDGSSGQDSSRRIAVLNAAAQHYHENLTDHPEIYDWLRRERGLTLATIEKHRLGWAVGNTLMQALRGKGFSSEEIKESRLFSASGQEFFQARVTIPYMVNGQVVQIRGKELAGKYYTPPGDKARLYNIDSVVNAKNVIITEGEFDALVLEQMGYTAVGSPGASVWQESWNGYVEEARRIYTCFDRDDAGDKGRERLTKVLGARVRHILMPEHDPLNEAKNDPTEWIVKKGHTEPEFRALVDAAGGSLLVTVDEAFAEWKQMEGNPNQVRLKFGYERLDGIIGGGIQPGQVAVILARTGTGKTIILCNIFHRMLHKQPDKKILFFSLEQTRNEWFERAYKIHRFFNPRATKMDTLDYYRDRFMMVDKNRVTEEEVRIAIEDFVDRLGSPPDVVAVDYLGYWARSFKGEGYQRTTDAIMKLKEMAKDLRIPFITPHQVNRGASNSRLDLTAARDSGAVEETADFLFGLNNVYKKVDDDRGGNEAVDKRTGELALDVLKSRHGGAGQEVRLYNAPLSLTIVSAESAAAEDARREWAWWERGESPEDCHLRRLTGITDLMPPWKTDPNWLKNNGFC